MNVELICNSILFALGMMISASNIFLFIYDKTTFSDLNSDISLFFNISILINIFAIIIGSVLLYYHAIQFGAFSFLFCYMVNLICEKFRINSYLFRINGVLERVLEDKFIRVIDVIKLEVSFIGILVFIFSFSYIL